MENKTRTVPVTVAAFVAVLIFLVFASFVTTPESVQQSYWSLIPPVIAIILALVTKEVYSSLFVGIITGSLLYSGFSFEGTMTHIFNDGIIASLSDSWNVGILIFLVFLGTIVQLMNRTGGSAAFGNWASRRIQSREGAQLATIALGVMIFIDDYFNCLTVGSVMRPVTDKFKVSRAKLAYLIVQLGGGSSRVCRGRKRPFAVYPHYSLQLLCPAHDCDDDHARPDAYQLRPHGSARV